MTPYFDILQGSEQWHAVRRGRPTASNFDKIITARKGELSKGADAYISELIAECFVQDDERMPTFWEQRGLELEPQARKAFTELTGLTIKPVGFVTRQEDNGVEIVGCSPDALVMDGNVIISGLETKCPKASTHVQYMRDGILPEAYIQQVHGSMAITGFDHWHFFSFYPGFQPFHLRVERDDYTEKLSAALDEFIIMYQEARASVIPKLKVTK